jgi:hypothetical protein
MTAVTNHTQSMAQEDKTRFANTDFSFTSGMGGVLNANNWTQTTPSCPTGTANLCYITFDPNHTNPSYALDANGKPNSTVLNIVNSNWATTADGAEIVVGGTGTGIFVHKKA